MVGVERLSSSGTPYDKKGKTWQKKKKKKQKRNQKKKRP